MISGLDAPCPACGQTLGDHTVRAWSACLGTATTDLPYEPTPSDLADAVRDKFGVDERTIVADHVVVRALTLGGRAYGLTIPAVQHEFQVGIAGRLPVEVARVLFLGNEQSVRGYGRLVRDNANRAANAAEKER